MPKSTCQDCRRTVFMANIRGQRVATDPELMVVVRVKQRMGGSSDGPKMEMATCTDFARRIHSERCQDYQNQDERERLSREMRAFTKNQKRPAAGRRNRGL